MNKADYYALAGALRAGADHVTDETRPDGLLSDLTAEQSRRVAVLLIAEVTAALAETFHTFSPGRMLAECGVDAEVAALHPATHARPYGGALSFNDVRPGDWIRYENRPGVPIIGRVRRRTEKTVQTEDEFAPTMPGVEWPSGHQLRRANWDRLHVTRAEDASLPAILSTVSGQAADAVDMPPRSDGGERREPRRRLSRAEAAVAAIEAARSYLARNGDLRVPAAHIEDGYRLGGWIHSQRYDYRHGTINPDRLAALDALDVSWRHGCEWGERR